MSKRKFKSFMDVVLVLLCLLPLIVFLIWAGNESIGQIPLDQILDMLNISEDLCQKIFEAIQSSFGIEFDGPGFLLACMIMANSILIYVFYVFVEVLVWLPKFAIRMIERSSNIE